MGFAATGSVGLNIGGNLGWSAESIAMYSNSASLGIMRQVGSIWSIKEVIMAGFVTLRNRHGVGRLDELIHCF